MELLDIEVGKLVRYTANPSDIWRVTRTSDKSVWLARCDSRGRFSSVAAPCCATFIRPDYALDMEMR